MKITGFLFSGLLHLSLKILIILTVIFLLLINNVYPAQVTFEWIPNSELDIDGYKIYYGDSSRNYQGSVDVGNITSYTLSDLKEGRTYYFAATAYNMYEIESDFSDEVVYTVSQDTDNDGILDDDEINIYGTDPSSPDTDEDGINDGEELAFWGDYWNDDYDGDGIINLVDPDSDNDGFTDGYEIYAKIQIPLNDEDPTFYEGIYMFIVSQKCYDENGKNFNIPNQKSFLKVSYKIGNSYLASTYRTIKDARKNENSCGKTDFDFTGLSQDIDVSYHIRSSDGKGSIMLMENPRSGFEEVCEIMLWGSLKTDVYHGKRQKMTHFRGWSTSYCMPDREPYIMCEGKWRAKWKEELQ